jgi:hypothetical protein
VKLAKLGAEGRGEEVGPRAGPLGELEKRGAKFRYRFKEVSQSVGRARRWTRRKRGRRGGGRNG